MTTIFISLELQNALSHYLQGHFIISTILNIIALFCLIRETPQNQATLRSYLIQIQIMITLNDLNLDLLFEPIPLFPECGGYCVGFLCQMGVPIRFSLGCAVLILINTGFSIIACFVHRHQVIVGVESSFKFNERIAFVLRNVARIVVLICALAWMFMDTNDEDKMDSLLNESYFNLTWIKSRGSYIFMERTIDVYIIISLLLILFSLSASGVSILFVHLFYILRRASDRRSKASMKNIYRSVIVLIVQLGVPAAFIVGPGGIILLALLFQFPPFEVCFTLYCLFTLHPLAHNIILLTITPAYRRFFTNFARKLVKKPNEKRIQKIHKIERTVSMVRH